MKAYLTTLNLLGNKVEGENPLPIFKNRQRSQVANIGNLQNWPKEMLEHYCEDNGYKLLPYKKQDRYDRSLRPQQYRLIVLENDLMRAEILPDFGGKIYALTDKRTGKDLVFRSPVMRLVNIAAREAWTAGGVEWNLGMHMHTYFACSTVFAARLQDDNGGDFVRIYEYERMRGIFFQLDFHLPESSDVLYTHARVVNDSGKDVLFDWWSDMGIAEEKSMRILAASDDVVYAEPIKEVKAGEFPYQFIYCKQEEMNRRKGFDTTYPENFRQASEFFLQRPCDMKAPWICAVYPDGFTFFNRSTDLIGNKKMYTWGLHNAGTNWRDYLVDKDRGWHLEIQSGICTTQHHGKLLRHGEALEWTEAFSSVFLDDAQEALKEPAEVARATVYERIETVLTEEALYTRHAAFSALVNRQPEEMLVEGTGFGSLERKRRESLGIDMPQGMVFPESALGKDQLPWLNLLRTGAYSDLGDMTPSYMTEEGWFELLRQSIESGASENAAAYVQYGVMLYERLQDEDAKAAWEKSIALRPTALAYRNLAVAYRAEGERENAELHMRQALDVGGLNQDAAFAEEYLCWLIEDEAYEKAWRFFTEKLSAVVHTDKMLLYASAAAVWVGEEDFALKAISKPLNNMREYENDKMTAEIYFTYCAAKLAKERSIMLSPKLVDEVRATEVVPQELDFRILGDF